LELQEVTERLLPRASSVETDTDSVISFTTATWYKLRMVRTDASTIKLYVDGVEKCSHTANIPTVAMDIAYQIQTNEALAKVLDIDFF